MSTAYSVPRVSNIIFVCGGNQKDHLRMRFRTYCNDNMLNYHILFPEDALSNFFSEALDEPFDIADFEKLIGQLSQAIVIFPEAPGSYAETGYFSAIEDLRKQSILVLDTKFQGSDSFISLGPAKKIDSDSIYRPVVNMDYENPDFDIIASRTRKLNTKKTRKDLNITNYKSLHEFELFSLIHGIVDLRSIATLDDVTYILRGMFSSHVSLSSIRKLISILVGSNYLVAIGKYGHLSTNKQRSKLLDVREGFKDDYSEIKLTLVSLFRVGDQEFNQLVEVSHNAA